MIDAFRNVDSHRPLAIMRIRSQPVPFHRSSVLFSQPRLPGLARVENNSRDLSRFQGQHDRKIRKIPVLL